MKNRKGFVLCVTLGIMAGALIAFGGQGQGMQRRGGPPGTLADQAGFIAALPPLMGLMDLDQDGRLSAAEIANAPAVLTALDKDKDGRLTADELSLGPAGRAGRSGEGVPRGRGPGGPGAAGVFDADRDGIIDAQEIARAATALSALDANSDGQLAPEEFFGGRGRGPGGMGPGALHAVLDADRDGVIDAQEIAGAPAAILSLDADKDGQVAAAEMFGGRGFMRGTGAPPEGVRGRGPGMRGEPLVRALDANQDGVLDASEISNAATALTALDKNKDGRLTPDELRPSQAF
jgi:Ca2+-binding EF-hand superfamily protein